MSDLGNKRVMGTNIMYYLNRDGITRKDLAKAIGVPYSTLTEWINGRAYPRIDKIEKMANYFGIEKADLVEYRDNDWLPKEKLELMKRVKVLTPEQVKTLLNVMDALNM